MHPSIPLFKVVQKVGMGFTLIGGFGLWFCKEYRELVGLTEHQFMRGNAGIAVWILSGAFILGLMILFPLSVVLQKRAGAPIPGPIVPRWIGYSLIAIALLLAAFILLVLTGIVVHMIAAS